MVENWTVPISQRSLRFKNDFVGFMTQLKLDPLIPSIRLDMGDPTLFVDFQSYSSANECLKDQAFNPKSSGLQDFRGDFSVREHLADVHSVADCKLLADDVFFEYGCAGVMFTVLNLICGPNDSVLASKVGFPLSKFQARALNIEIREYDLVHEGDWEPDFESLERQVASNTKLLIVTNPSNPMGSVWGRTTLEKIVEFAERHNLVILCDEVYSNLCYSKPFISMGEIPANIPVICARSVSKSFMLCGVRLGWGLLYDRRKILKSFPDTLKRLKITELHPCSIAINALPHILAEVPDEYINEVLRKLKERVDFVMERASTIPAITPIESFSGMFMILKLDLDRLGGFESTYDFVIKLASETGLSFLPGELIGMPGFLRILLCPKIEVIGEGLDRLKDFIVSKYR